MKNHSFDLGKYEIYRQDDCNWIVRERFTVTGENVRGKKAREESIGKERIRTLSYHPNIEQAIEEVIRLSGDDVDCHALKDYIDRLEDIWDSIKKHIRNI